MIEYKRRLDTYILSLCLDEVDELKEMEEYAAEFNVPIIKKGAREFLRTVLTVKKPANILEIGTAIGFSAILMAKLSPDSVIKTIENYDKRISVARDNFKKYGFDDRITLVEDDAVSALKRENTGYDFIFLDASKAQYITLLPDIIRLLNSGGILIADNVLYGNNVLEPKLAVNRRDRTIHLRLREYLYEVTHNKNLRSSVVPIDDGICMSVKL